MGDLERPEAWTGALTGVDTVLHLAARTGKASKADHERLNRDATAALVDAAARQGVKRFLFVSSIAAGFADQRHYHYARAKAEAEALVTRSGIESLVLRPTMIFGPGSPVLENLRKLALLPIPVMFGPGTELQPIQVDDLARAMVASLGFESWPAEPVELGGPETIHQTELFARIRRLAGRPERRPIHLPLGAARAALAALEPFALGILPFTAGQLAAFANPATARSTPFAAVLPRPEHGIDAMIGR
jgi:uncharacterized protein YbjT (DUF2867 family)